MNNLVGDKFNNLKVKPNKRILFLTGTRADFGKLKPLIQAVDAQPGIDWSIFVTGMHTLSRYGYTVDEVYKNLDLHRLEGGFRNIYVYMNQMHGESMDLILANTIAGLSRYVHEFTPDMIVVHGDRIETMAGAIVGALRNILVAHIEGGEISGTVDELIRHSVSKLAHIHFVANNEAFTRLKQLGENPESIYIIGSPDIDVMLSPDLMHLNEVRDRYDIRFSNYALVLFHPVTTDEEGTASQAREMLTAMMKSGENYVVIYPNNDHGCDAIFQVYEEFKNHKNFLFFPSIRFESFLTLLKNADFIIGNSSVGVREAPVYGVYSINLGARQRDRFRHSSILDVTGDWQEILAAIKRVKDLPPHEPCNQFGDGRSAELFADALQKKALWDTPRQKQFFDVLALR